MSSSRAAPARPTQTTADRGLVKRSAGFSWVMTTPTGGDSAQDLTWRKAGGAEADEAAFVDQIRRMLQRAPCTREPAQHHPG